MSAAIAWHPGDGSGFTFSRADLLLMSVSDLVHFAEEAHARRKAEAAAHERAAAAARSR